MRIQHLLPERHLFRGSSPHSRIGQLSILTLQFQLKLGLQFVWHKISSVSPRLRSAAFARGHSWWVAHCAHSDSRKTNPPDVGQRYVNLQTGVWFTRPGSSSACERITLTCSGLTSTSMTILFEKRTSQTYGMVDGSKHSTPAGAGSGRPSLVRI